MMIRLDKYLADMGIGTRTEVKQMIRKGRITVDGITIKKPETKVHETDSRILVDGRELNYVQYEYYLLNKPAGVVSTTEDKTDRTVIDLIQSKRRKDLFPVGRLDKDTEGLLLITNDGALAHRLLSPRKHVDKTYYAQIKGRVTEDTVRAFEKGVDIGVGKQEMTMPAKLEILRADDISDIRLTIQEGKFHQVKRMFQAVGMEVIYLKRESMGALELDDELNPGDYRPLTREELEKLL